MKMYKDIKNKINKLKEEYKKCKRKGITHTILAASSLIGTLSAYVIIANYLLEIDTPDRFPSTLAIILTLPFGYFAFGSAGYLYTKIEKYFKKAKEYKKEISELEKKLE